MLKGKLNVFLTTFVVILLFLTVLKYSYGKKIENDNNWKVVITSDSKEINDTHEIKFKVNKSKDVVEGKIAPGLTATAEIDIDLTEFKDYVDIEIEIDDSKLCKAFSLNAKLDGKNLNSTKIEKVKTGKVKKVLLELVWNENVENTKIGINIKSIEIPIKIRVSQDI